MSDRQLSADWYNFLRVDAQTLISKGYMWGWDYAKNLASGATDFLSMTTGAKPVNFSALAMQTTGDRGVHVELFAGGSISLGTPRTGLPLNHNEPKPSPFSLVEESGSIDVPGILIGQFDVGVGSGGSIGQTSGPLAIFAAETFYYMVIENLHNQAADITLDMNAAALGPNNLV